MAFMRKKIKKKYKEKIEISSIIECILVVLISVGVLIILVTETNKYNINKINSDYIIRIYDVIDKVKENIKSGKIDVSNENATYYIPISCVNKNDEFKSPYGKFKEANIAVVQNEGKYEYLWNSVDVKGYGVEGILEYNRITEDIIKPNLTENNLITNIALYNTKEVIVFNNNCSKKNKTYH